MRRLIALGAIVLFVLAAVPLASGSTTPVVKHVDGTVSVWEPPKSEDAGTTRTWLARFEVRTTTTGTVQFGYLELYGTGSEQLGEIHQYAIDQVNYFKTTSGAQGATLEMHECIMVPAQACFPATYQVSDGGLNDTFNANFDNPWVVQSGNISIYSTGGQNGQ